MPLGFPVLQFCAFKILCGVGILPLGSLLDKKSYHEGDDPHDDGDGKPRIQKDLGIGNACEAHESHHGRSEGAEEESRGSCAVKDHRKGAGSYPTAATMGMRMGAIMAFAPARVPRRLTRRTELIMVVRIAFWGELTPIFLVTR